MPRYFFDVIDDGNLTTDQFGTDLEDFEEAREQAQCLLPDIARGELPFGDRHSFVCEVRDEAERIIYRGELRYEGTQFSPISRSISSSEQRGTA